MATAWDLKIGTGQVPQTVPGLSMWLEADRVDGAASPADGALVTAWQDLSGNGFHLTAPSGSEPVMATAGGQRAVQFDGVNDLLRRHDGAVVDMSVGMSAYLVASVASLSTPSTYWAATSDSTATPVAAMDVSSTNRTNRFFRRSDAAGLSLVETAATTGATVLLAGRSAVGAAVEMWENGASKGSTAATYTGPGSDTTFSVGARLSASSSTVNQWSQYLQGQVRALVIYNAEHTTAQRQAVEDYLAAKFGLTLSR